MHGAIIKEKNHSESLPEICSNVSTKLESQFFEVYSTHFRFMMIHVLLQTPTGYVTFKTSQMVHRYIRCD